jgi:3-oxoacyl-[acyl-carrier protein] reductase
MMINRWGRIINLSSVAAQWGGVIGPHYSASKAGVLGLTRSYASLLAREGITVNAIALALIETEMVAQIPNLRPDIIPVGRFGAVDEVAEAVGDQIAVLRAFQVFGSSAGARGSPREWTDAPPVCPARPWQAIVAC